MQPHSTPNTKRCCTCKGHHELASFNKNRARPDGLQDQCRTCQRISGNTYFRSHPEKAKAYYAENRQKIIDRSVAWQKANRTKCREASRRHYQRHPEKHKAYRESRAHLQAAYLRDWRRRNLERERLRGLTSQRKRNEQIRRNTVGRVNYADILARDGLRCHICGGDVEAGGVHFDHVIPIGRGGHHSVDNIKVSHADCNRRKGAKLLAS